MNRNLDFAALKKDCSSLSLNQAHRLFKERRVYKVRHLPGEGWTGLVLNQQGIPYQAWWHESRDTLSFRCECQSPLPCIHVLALGCDLDQRSEIHDRELKSLIRRESGSNALKEERRRALSRGIGRDLDLFDEGLDQPSLFDSPAGGSQASQEGGTGQEDEELLLLDGGLFGSPAGKHSPTRPSPPSIDGEMDQPEKPSITLDSAPETLHQGPTEIQTHPGTETVSTNADAHPGPPQSPASGTATEANTETDPVTGTPVSTAAIDTGIPATTGAGTGVDLSGSTRPGPASASSDAEPEALSPASRHRARTAQHSGLWSLSLHPSFPHRPELVAELRKGDPLYHYDNHQAGAAWWQDSDFLPDLSASIENSQRRRFPLGEVLAMAWKKMASGFVESRTIMSALPLQGMGRNCGTLVWATGLEVQARQADAGKDKPARETVSLEARALANTWLAKPAITTLPNPAMEDQSPGIPDLGSATYPDSSSDQDFRPLSQWVAEGAWVYSFRQTDARLWVIHNPALAKWIRQAQGPGRAMPVSQAMALRERGLVGLPDVLEFPPPEGEESLYETVDPSPILSLQGGQDRTEIYLSFSYRGVETSFRDDRDHVSRRLRGGLTLIHPRKQDEENRKLMELKGLLEELILFEGGLYAGLVSSGPVADFSLNAGFSEFLVEWGKELMQLGFELRYEGSPIRSAGGISFRAESGMDWFGLRAQWTDGPVQNPDGDSAGDPLARPALSGFTAGSWTNPDGSPGTAPNGTGPDRQSAMPGSPGSGFNLSAADRSLLVDSHLDSAGLAQSKGSDGKDCWILLAQRDLDRLRVLRTLGMDKNGLLETSPVNLTLIESLYDDIENKDEEGVRKAEALMKELGRIHPQWGEKDIMPDLVPQPKGLNAELRAYQLAGYNWLLGLHNHQLGGCLADDMGLGKTIQTIALLQHLKENRQLGPSLLVCPVVTLANWEDEVARFAPELKLYRHTGTTRLKSLDEILSPTLEDNGNQPDIILVSYHTLRNDLDIFVTQVWDYIILDEAHYIKNAHSQLFKAVKVLGSKHRLSLTGTPIENSTMELWSQFNFLNPGLLGTKRQFQTNTAAKIEKEADEEARDQLRATIKPFLLRRRKEDVLADLPPKEEILYWTEMEKEQEKIYQAHREEFKARLGGIIDKQGIEGSRMEVLRFMLRLRQLAIHPGMIKDAEGRRPFAHIPSCKQEALSMLLDESIQEDHKILVFSQFVSALRLLGEQLDLQGRRYQLLSGQTKDRGDMVKKFKEDADLRIFLLSLKAGGVGINLTQADYVVLFDPWWNPAAEQQAVDRAHRMGQKRPVIVYKFITRGTIEEKILLLQKKKHSLAGSLISEGGEGEGLLSRFNEEDLMELFSSGSSF